VYEYFKYKMSPTAAWRACTPPPLPILKYLHDQVSVGSVLRHRRGLHKDKYREETKRQRDSRRVKVRGKTNEEKGSYVTSVSGGEGEAGTSTRWDVASIKSKRKIKQVPPKNNIRLQDLNWDCASYLSPLPLFTVPDWG
jgi:hypothetical protein